MKKDMHGILEFVIKSPLKTLTFGRQERRERATFFSEKEEKREKRRFFSSCPDFIKCLIPLHPWSDRVEIWRRGSWLMYLQLNGGDRIWSFGQSLERKRRREKNNGFLHHAQISSKVRCRFVHGLIELKFGGEVHKSLILNLNGEDRIWTIKNFLLTLFNHIFSIIW